jgi:hypothetical protein
MEPKYIAKLNEKGIKALKGEEFRIGIAYHVKGRLESLVKIEEMRGCWYDEKFFDLYLDPENQPAEDPSSGVILHGTPQDVKATIREIQSQESPTLWAADMIVTLRRSLHRMIDESLACHSAIKDIKNILKDL